MNEKHTPGPWHVETDNEGRNVDIQDAKGRGVLTKANARLIAAAPDLLAALERAEVMLRKSAERGIYDGEGVNLELESADEARAAIARAKGEA